MGRNRTSADTSTEVQTETLETADITSTPDEPVESQPAVNDEGESTTDELSPTEPGPVDGMTPTETMASPMGGSDNYAYLDQTRIPLHERNLSAVNNPLTEASQAELNPAFTAKAEDGGPANSNDESIGTEPNVYDAQRAAIEESGDEEALAAFDAQVEANKEQQIDAEAVTQAAADREAQLKNDEPTPAGAPSGMEPSSDGEAGTAGAQDSA